MPFVNAISEPKMDPAALKEKLEKSKFLRFLPVNTNVRQNSLKIGNFVQNTEEFFKPNIRKIRRGIEQREFGAESVGVFSGEEGGFVEGELARSKKVKSKQQASVSKLEK